jgi:hypothetical protein
MGLFWDKLKRIFNKPEQIAVKTEQYERNERADHIDAADWTNDPVTIQNDDWARQIDPQKYKQSSGEDLELLKTTYVGFVPKPYNKQLHHRKEKSQRKNWKYWKNK